MKFYIAGRSNQRGEIKKIYKRLEAEGHEITVDWTVHKEIKPYDQHADIAKDYAVQDMNGIIDCDVFVLLSSEVPGSGSSGELGAAILSHVKFGTPKIYVIGEYMGNNFFYFHPTVERRDTIDTVLKEVL